MSGEDRLDNMVAKAETDEPDCRDCEVGEPHVCPRLSMVTADPGRSGGGEEVMNIGALREALINATDLGGVFGQNIHESKTVMLRIGDQVLPLGEVSVGFHTLTGRFVMYLTALTSDPTARRVLDLAGAREQIARALGAHRVGAFNGQQTACTCDRTWRWNAEHETHLRDHLLGVLASQERGE